MKRKNPAAVQGAERSFKGQIRRIFANERRREVTPSLQIGQSLFIPPEVVLGRCQTAQRKSMIELQMVARWLQADHLFERAGLFAEKLERPILGALALVDEAQARIGPSQLLFAFHRIGMRADESLNELQRRLRSVLGVRQSASLLGKKLASP